MTKVSQLLVADSSTKASRVDIIYIDGQVR